MEPTGIKYEFESTAFEYSSSEDISGWVFVSLPKEMAVEIRNGFKSLEEGWGRMKVTAKAGNTEWQTSIWFDKKQDTYLLPLKAAVRKKVGISLEDAVGITIWI